MLSDFRDAENGLEQQNLRALASIPTEEEVEEIDEFEAACRDADDREGEDD